MEHTEHAELPLIPITLDFIAHQLDVQQNGILAEYGITSRNLFIRRISRPFFP